MPKISVIMPIYNTQAYLRKCLDSIVNQTFKDIEIICVDDGSTDSSLEILKEYAKNDPRFIIREQKNLGAESARAIAMTIAQGEFIHFFDSDDWADLTMYEKMYNAITESNADLIICSAILINEDGSTDAKWTDYHTVKQSGLHNIENDKPVNMPPHLWSKFYRRSIIEKNEIQFPYDNDIRLGFDDVFTLLYILSSKTCYYLQDALYFYLQRQQSIMHNARSEKSERIDAWRVFRYMYEHINKHDSGQYAFSVFLEKFRWVARFYYQYFLSNEGKRQSVEFACEFLPAIDKKYGDTADILKKYFTAVLDL